MNKYFRPTVDSVALMGNVNFKALVPLILTVDLWSVADVRYARDSFFSSSVLCNARTDAGLQSVIHFINEVLAGMSNTHTHSALIAQPALMAIITLSLSIRGLCNVIRPPLPQEHTHTHPLLSTAEFYKICKMLFHALQISFDLGKLKG